MGQNAQDPELSPTSRPKTAAYKKDKGIAFIKIDFRINHLAQHPGDPGRNRNRTAIHLTVVPYILIRPAKTARSRCRMNFSTYHHREYVHEDMDLLNSNDILPCRPLTGNRSNIAKPSSWTTVLSAELSPSTS